MIKLIATDIDGTLVKDGTLQIDAEYMTVIDKLIRKGIHVVVCSGRQFVSEKKLFSPIRDELLYITGVMERGEKFVEGNIVKLANNRNSRQIREILAGFELCDSQLGRFGQLLLRLVVVHVP